MHEIQLKKYKDNAPIVSDDKLNDEALMILQDYKPELLDKAMPIDYQHFIEFYLKLNLQFGDIYNKSGDGKILGATSFNDESKIVIYNEDRSKLQKILLKRGSIILDNSLLKVGQEGRQTITGLHEGGHWLMHQKYYSENPQQISMFDLLPTENNDNKMVSCKKEIIECSDKRELITPIDFMEHHANVLAAALAMPYKTVIPLCEEYLKHRGYRNRAISVKTHKDSIVYKGLKCLCSNTYKVSQKAAEIRLNKLGILVDKENNNMLNFLF